MEEKKYVYRLPPCPDYEIAKVESWLTDMAKEGLILEADTPFFGFYGFYKAAPQYFRYRMEPALKTQGFFDWAPGQPKEDAQNLYAEMGWEYVTRYGDFHIYRCSDPHAPELHTDEEIQAEALNVLKKRHRSNLIWDVLFIALYLQFGVLRYPASMIVAMGLFCTVCLYGAFLSQLLHPVLSLVRLSKLRRQLLDGDPIHKHADWKSHVLRSRIFHNAPGKMFTLLLVLLLISQIAQYDDEIKLADFTGQPPFITIADLNPEGAYVPEGFDYANRVRNWSYWPFVDNWDWYEYAAIQLDNGETVSGPLDVKYHRTLSPILANQLAKELIAYADTGKYFTEATSFDTGYENIRGFQYHGKYGLDTVMLICDNIVVEAQILVDNAEGVSAKELWIALMCQKLISE
jgi:hypothetical protein